MNILLVYKEADIATYKMLEGLSKLEDFNIYIASPQSYTDKKIYGNCTPLDLPVITSKFNWNVIRALREIIKTYRIDLIYSPSSSGLSNALFASIGTRAKNIAYRGTQAKLKRFDPTYYLGILNPAVEHVVDKPGFHRPLIVSPDREGARVAEWSVTAEGYGRFLCDVFDQWVVGDVGRYYVQMFDASLAQWCGVQPGVCSMGETCGDALVVEHNGDVYSCDHFVYPEYKLGNIAQTPLDEIYRTAKRREFGLNKRNTLPTECLRCKFYFACRGECPKHRFDRGADGSPKNSLCEGLKIYFRHVEPYMEYMRDLLSKQQAPAWVMPFARKRMGLE